MNAFTRFIAWLRSAPKTAEEIEAVEEGARMHEEMETIRLSQRSIAGSNYETRRGSDPESY